MKEIEKLIQNALFTEWAHNQLQYKGDYYVKQQEEIPEQATYVNICVDLKHGRMVYVCNNTRKEVSICETKNF